MSNINLTMSPDLWQKAFERETPPTPEQKTVVALMTAATGCILTGPDDHQGYSTAVEQEVDKALGYLAQFNIPIRGTDTLNQYIEAEMWEEVSKVLFAVAWEVKRLRPDQVRFE